MPTVGCHNMTCFQFFGLGTRSRKFRWFLISMMSTTSQVEYKLSNLQRINSMVATKLKNRWWKFGRCCHCCNQISSLIQSTMSVCRDNEILRKCFVLLSLITRWNLVFNRFLPKLRKQHIVTDGIVKTLTKWIPCLVITYRVQLLRLPRNISVFLWWVENRLWQ